MSHSFYFPDSPSPTVINLQRYLLLADFVKTNSSKQADFNDDNLTLDETATQILEYKHLLADLVNKHCPEIMPTTYCINEDNFPQVLEHIQQQHVDANWILKPALLNNAEGIRLFAHINDVATHFLGNKRYDGEHVLQHYIDKPHLLNDHKYTLRMFVVITNCAGVYLYKYGYFNIGREKYDSDDLSRLNKHLTNEHLNPDHSPNTWQMPTTNVPHFDKIYQQIHTIVSKTIDALRNEKPTLFNQQHNTQALSFFGFDFILDEDLRLWLLEVNHGPCFPIDDSHVLQKHLYEQFWQAIVAHFVTPIVEQHPQKIGHSELFDKI